MALWWKGYQTETWHWELYFISKEFWVLEVALWKSMTSFQPTSYISQMEYPLKHALLAGCSRGFQHLLLEGAIMKNMLRKTNHSVWKTDGAAWTLHIATNTIQLSRLCAQPSPQKYTEVWWSSGQTLQLEHIQQLHIPEISRSWSAWE